MKLLYLLIRWDNNHNHVPHRLATPAQKRRNLELHQSGDVLSMHYDDESGVRRHLRQHNPLPSFGDAIQDETGKPVHSNFLIIEQEIDHDTVKPFRFDKYLDPGVEANGVEPLRLFQMSRTVLRAMVSQEQRTTFDRDRRVRLSLSDADILDSPSVMITRRL